MAGTFHIFQLVVARSCTNITESFDHFFEVASKVKPVHLDTHDRCGRYAAINWHSEDILLEILEEKYNQSINQSINFLLLNGGVYQFCWDLAT